MNRIKCLVVMALVQLLVACGGGSSTDSSPPVASSPTGPGSSSLNSTPGASSVSSSSSSLSSVAVSSPGNSSVSSTSATSSSRQSSISVSSTSSVSSRSSATVSSVTSSSISSSLISSLSTSSSASSQQSASIAAPQNLVVSAANQGVGLQWSPVSGATSYNIFYATEAGITAQNIAAYENGTLVQGATSPFVIGGLSNGQRYYFVVTAVNTQSESLQSNEVSAHPQAVVLSNQPSAQEVLILELVNRARFDPEAEASRYGIGLNDGDTNISSARKPPLAHSTLLISAAREHSQWMIDSDIFSHTGVAGSTPTERIQAAGYGLSGSWTTGENIAWQGTTGQSIDLTQAAVSHHELLFKSAGHRINILTAGFRELGIGQRQGMFLHEGTNYLASMVTQNFARSGGNYFLTGVIYQDGNANNFYDVGEGLADAIITVNGQAYSALSTGAYTIPITNGNYTLAVGGAALGESVQHAIQVNNANRKIDVIKRGDNVDVVSW